MRTLSPCVLLTVVCWSFGAGAAWAMPITWRASGVITWMSDHEPFGELDAISVGTPWTLDLTFDPDAPGILAPHSQPGKPPTYYYHDVVNARFQLGAFEYTSLGDIYVNADLPWIGSSSNDGKPGLVQFEMHNRWMGGGGGPDLNLGEGLMLASYNDANAVDGSLPSLPVWSAEQGVFGGLWWTTLRSYPYSDFVSAFNPAVVDATVTPEPASLLLVGSGLALLAVRRRRRRHS